MPIFTIETPSGQTFDIEAPEGATDDQILSFAQSQGLFNWQAQQAQQTPTRFTPEQMEAFKADALQQTADETGPIDAFGVGVAEGVLKLGRFFGLADDASELEKKAYEALQKSSPIATGAGEIAGETAPFLVPGLMQPTIAAKLGGGAIARAGTAAGIGAAEAGTLAAVEGQEVAPSAAIGAGIAGGLELAFPKIGKAFQQFTKNRAGEDIVSSTGEISRDFERALANEGLTLNNLVDVARLPQIADDAALDPMGRLSEKAAIKIAANSVVKQQIQKGGRHDELATVMIESGKVVDDKVAQKAKKQGFQEGTISAAKTTNSATKKEMLKALKLAFDISKKSSISLEKRPSDFAGIELVNRIKFIRDKANDARKELDEIAKKKLNVPFDNTVVDRAIEKVFQDLDIVDLNAKNRKAKKDNPALNISPSEQIPKPDYTGSAITGDKSSKRAINELIRILREEKRADALGAHKMKRKLDRLINYSKRPSAGLGVEGENAIKSVRTVLNNELRSKNEDYARVNDVLSRSLSAFDDLQSAVGPSIDLSMENLATGLGTKIKTLHSQAAKRAELINAFNTIDDVARGLDGKFEVDYRDISLFAREIEDVFGKVAKTSLGGEVEGSLKSVANQGLTGAARDKVIDKVAKKFSKQDTFEAYDSMREILKRGQ